MTYQCLSKPVLHFSTLFWHTALGCRVMYKVLLEFLYYKRKLLEKSQVPSIWITVLTVIIL